MISVTTILIVAISAIVYYYFFKRDKRFDKYPPGPLGLPFFGHLFQLGTFPHQTFLKWSKKYGKTFSIRFVQERVVVLHDMKMIREMFNEIAFSGRILNEIFLPIPGNYGVLASEGHVWEEQRRFTLRHLRDFGFGKNSMELLINEEVREILDWMKKEDGRPVSVNRRFNVAALNSLWVVVSGKRFDQNDSTLNDMMAHVQETTNEVFQKGIATFMPALAKRFPVVSGYKKLRGAVTDVVEFVGKEMAIHKENSQEGETNDFMQLYLEEVKKTKDPKSTFYKEEGEKNFKVVVNDLFTAGGETISTNLTWMVICILRHPEVQQKLHKEIDDVIGKSRSPSLSDRPQMAYTEATINEMLRYTSAVPIGVPHKVLFDTEFNGFFFPKGTWLFYNLHSIHHDKEFWGDPEKFRPERFIKDGKIVSKPEAFMPFVVGKRACPGETFARDSLFLFLTGIFQRFQLLPDPANPKPTLEPAVGFVLLPKPFTVIWKERNN